MTKSLFKISNLCCAYKNKKEVLTIPELDIPRGKLVVLLGQSGSGKSTLLETLGLMNNTIKSGDVVFHPSDDKSSISYRELWMKKRNFNQVSWLRKEYFSFIFQNTNLMPNFTAIENACLTQMIKGIPWKDAEERVIDMMEKLKLTDIPQDKQTKELSGGEKQRVAFVRAITPEFSVLFGDEPTGNLDPIISYELISILDQNIREHQRSAIVVSHNIELSVRFADSIIVLKKNGKNQPFLIVPEQHFRKTPGIGKWHNHSNFLVDNITETIYSLMAEN